MLDLANQKRLYKIDVVRLVAKDTRLSQRVVADVLNGALRQITSALTKEKSVAFPGFGTFHTRMRLPSMARSFKTGEPIQVPTMRVTGFRAGKLLKQAVRRERKAK